MTQYHLHLKGYVGGSDFNADDVTATLRSNPDTEVSVLIDSTGGQLSTALSIYSAFRSHGNVHAHFVGMNASAATIASLGAKRITMDASALYLVHKCSMAVFEWASMNADQLQDYITALLKQKTDLDKMDSNVSAMYAARCRKPQEDLLALMKTGGWLTAKEALEWGFVDELTELEGDEKPELTEALVHAMAEAQMPIPSIPYSDNGRHPQHSEPLFSRFMAAMASLFKPSVENNTAAPSIPATETSTSNTIPKPTAQMKHYTRIEAALKTSEGFTPNAEGSVTLTEAQLQSLEDHISAQETRISEQETRISDQEARITTQESQLTERQNQISAQEGQLTERNSRITELEAEVTALKATPADTTTNVVNAQTGEQRQYATGAQEYMATRQRAKDLYNLIS